MIDMPGDRGGLAQISARRTRAGGDLWILLIGWLALLIVGCVVGSLVASNRPGFDPAAVEALRDARTSGLTDAMRVVTWFGSPVCLNLVFVSACAVLVWRRAWMGLAFLALASPGVVLMVQIIKHTVDRARPVGFHLTDATGPSWPSGHASSSAALYGALIIIALQYGLLESRIRRLVVVITVGLLLALIGVSRVYLGVHYPSDVVAGWLLALAWLAIVHHVFSRRRRRLGVYDRSV